MAQNLEAPVMEGASVNSDVAPPDRSSSSSAPPALRTDSLFAWKVEYAKVFTDIRSHPDYQSFVSQLPPEKAKKLPQPLEGHFLLDNAPVRVDEDESMLYQQKVYSAYPEGDQLYLEQVNNSMQEMQLHERRYADPHNKGRLSHQYPGMRNPVPRKPQPGGSLDGYQVDHRDAVPTMGRFAGDHATTYSSSPSAQIAFNTANYIWKDEDASGHHPYHPNNGVGRTGGGGAAEMGTEHFHAADAYGQSHPHRGHHPRAKGGYFPHPGKNNAPFDDSDGQQHSRSSNVLCRYFAAGYCSRGDKCFFSHDPSLQVPHQHQQGGGGYMDNSGSNGNGNGNTNGNGNGMAGLHGGHKAIRNAPKPKPFSGPNYGGGMATPIANGSIGFGSAANGNNGGVVVAPINPHLQHPQHQQHQPPQQLPQPQHQQALLQPQQHVSYARAIQQGNAAVPPSSLSASPAVPSSAPVSNTASSNLVGVGASNNTIGIGNVVATLPEVHSATSATPPPPSSATPPPILNPATGTPTATANGLDLNGGTASGDLLYTNFEQLIGKIYLVSKDQQGCRFLQKKLEEQDAKTVQVIFDEVYHYITELMTDPFGNYLCQKLLEHCNNDHRLMIVERVAPNLVEISKNMHGTRAVQKMIECLSSPAQVQLIKRSLCNSVVELIQDLNGNHVIQRCLNRLSAEDNQFIYDAVTTGSNCVQVATHRHGCCVLQRCIDHASEKQKVQLIHEITKNALTLVQDPYGNYVVQYVLELPFPNLVESLARSFAGHIRQLATQKFSSNVVEKVLAVAGPSTRTMMITEILSEDNLIAMLQDPFANYVVQTALTVSDPGQHVQLVEAIKPYLNQLRNTPYGKRIQSKIAKESTERQGGLKRNDRLL